MLERGITLIYFRMLLSAGPVDLEKFYWSASSFV